MTRGSEPPSADWMRAAFAAAAGATGPAARDDLRAELGAITLHEHQREAAARCLHLIERHGGGLLADQVGLGKTFVALAVARSLGGALVVAPAALRAQWARAAERAGIASLPFVSFDALSRGADPSDEAPLVIVDEAHHARSPATCRHRALARQGARRPLLLLSATPVHNSARDLAHLLSLFMGERARRAPLAELQALVVRRTDAALPSAPVRPALAVSPPLGLPEADDLLDDIVRLPPAVPPHDGGVAATLVTLGLVRAWASSDAALLATLRRRLTMARAFADALEAGRQPARRDLDAWVSHDATQQLAFPTLVTAAAAVPGNAAALLPLVQAHADGVRELIARLTHGDARRDLARAAHLRAVASAPGARVLAFTHSADTAHALFRLLRDRAGTGVLTADGAIVAGGRLTRREALERFAPRAQGATPVGPRDDINLLIATDLLAEGLNLQDANTVVHLDLPWTPARLEQRIGRVVRPESPHGTVRLFTFAPPARAHEVARVEWLLRTKLAQAQEALGAMPLGIVALPGTVAPPLSLLEAREALQGEMLSWRRGAGETDTRGWPPEPSGLAKVTALLADSGEWTALVPRCVGSTARLVVGVGDTISDDPFRVLAIVRVLGAASSLRSLDASVERGLERWCAHEAAAVRAGLDAGGGVPSPMQRTALARMRAAIQSAPPHERAARATLGERARPALELPPSAQRDHLLRGMADAHPVDDDRWLRALAALPAPSAPSAPAAPPAPDADLR